MRVFYKTILLLLFICGFNQIISAQTMERSNEIDQINGKKVFIHTVKQGETVYNLCKLYNCTEQDIKRLNPGALVQGIQVDQKILFPYSEPIKPRSFSESTMTHTVEKGETMYGISKKYNLTISELLSKNPSLTEGIKIGDVLNIPVIKNSEKGEQSNTKVATPTKQKSVDSKQLKKEALFPSNHQTKVDTVKTSTTIPTVNKCDSLFAISKKRTTKIAIVFPFCVKDNDSVTSSNSSLGKEDRIYGKSLPYLEFYEGALLAIDSLKRLGYSLQLFVYDSQRDSMGISGIIKEMASKGIDVIIGSNDQDGFEQLASFAKRNAIPIVSPLSTNLGLASNNPQVFMANTPLKCRLQAEAQYALSLKKNHYVFIHNGHLNEIENIEKIKSFLLPSFGGDTAKMSKQVKVVKFSTYSMSKVESAMSAEENIVIIPSEDQAFVNDVLTKLNNYKRRYAMELHGMAMWESFKNLELDYLYDLHFKCATSTYRDYTDPRVKQFVSSYRNIYKNEPSKIAFLGFDVLIYFGTLSAKYGKQLATCGILEKYSGIQNSFSFSSIGKGAGFYNSYVNILEYGADYKRTIIPIKINIKATQIEPTDKKHLSKPSSKENADSEDGE